MLRFQRKCLGKLRAINTSFEIAKLSWAFWFISISSPGIEIHFFSKSLLKKNSEISSYISSSLIAPFLGLFLVEIVNFFQCCKEKTRSSVDVMIEISSLKNSRLNWPFIGIWSLCPPIDSLSFLKPIEEIIDSEKRVDSS